MNKVINNTNGKITLTYQSKGIKRELDEIINDIVKTYNNKKIQVVVNVIS